MFNNSYYQNHQNHQQPQTHLFPQPLPNFQPFNFNRFNNSKKNSFKNNYVDMDLERIVYLVKDYFQ